MNRRDNAEEIKFIKNLRRMKGKEDMFKQPIVTPELADLTINFFGKKNMRSAIEAKPTTPGQKRRTLEVIRTVGVVIAVALQVCILSINVLIYLG